MRVLPISPSFDKTVTVRGNVADPGRFAWHPGMKLSELLPNSEALVTRDYWQKAEPTRAAFAGLPAGLCAALHGVPPDPGGEPAAVLPISAAEPGKAVIRPAGGAEKCAAGRINWRHRSHGSGPGRWPRGCRGPERAGAQSNNMAYGATATTEHYAPGCADAGHGAGPADAEYADHRSRAMTRSEAARWRMSSGLRGRRIPPSATLPERRLSDGAGDRLVLRGD